MKRNKSILQKCAALLPFLIVGIFGVYFLNYSLALQPWANSDSSVYINLAKNIAEGKGFVTNYPSGRLAFVGLHPPFYSIVLSLFPKFHIAWVDGIKYLNITVFALFLIICGVWTFKLTKNYWAGLLVSISLLVTPDIFIAHNGAMSEALYLLLALVSMFMLVEALLNPKTISGWLILSAILAGLASYTRFVGASSILAGCLLLLFFRPSSLKKRLGAAFLYGAIGSLPLLSWLAIKGLFFSSDSSRSFVLPTNLLHLCAKLFYGVLDTFVSWFPLTASIPDARPRRWIFLGLCLVFLGIFTILNLKKLRSSFIARDSRILLGIAALLSMGTYLIVFLLSYIFSTVPPDICGRTLITLIPYLMVSLVSLLGMAFYGIRNFKSYVTAFLCLIIAANLILANPIKTYNYAQESHHTKSGYLQEKYVQSELMQAIRNLPDQSLLISNQAPLILLHTGKYPYDFPEFTCERIQARKDIPFGAGDTEDDLRYRDGLILAMFKEDIDHLFVTCLPDNWIANRQVFLNRSVPVVTTADGVLYKYDPNGK